MDGLKRLVPGTQEHREHEEKESHSSYERVVHDSYTGGSDAGGVPTVAGGGAGGLAGNLDSTTTRPHTGGVTGGVLGGHRDSAALHHQGVETPIGAGAGALAGVGTSAEQGHGVLAHVPGTQEHHMHDQARHAAHGTTGSTMSKIKSHLPGTSEHRAAKTTGI